MRVADGEGIGPGLGGGIGIGRIDAGVFGVRPLQDRPIDLVGGYMDEPPDAMPPGIFEQPVGAEDIGLHKRQRIADGMIDKRPRREVHDPIDIFAQARDIAEQIAVHQVHPPGLLRAANEIEGGQPLEIPLITAANETAERELPRPLAQQIAHERGPNKPRRAGDKNFHGNQNLAPSRKDRQEGFIFLISFAGFAALREINQNLAQRRKERQEGFIFLISFAGFAALREINQISRKGAKSAKKDSFS
jgi:hypothetical protein